MPSLQLIDLVILAFVEGVADVLPIDSSAHAQLVAWLFQWRAGAIGIAIHFGALLAVTVYLWRDLASIAVGIWRLRKRRVESGARLGAKALGVSIPWIAASVYLGDAPLREISNLVLIGIVTIVCALMMIAADRMSMTVKRVEHLTFGGIGVMALFQLLALVPGVGRVAILATTARLLGLERGSAFRFVLLSQIPVLLGAIVSGAAEYWGRGIRPTEGDLLAFAVTFVCVLPAVALATAWMDKRGLLPFALYRILLGAALIALTRL